MTLRMLSTNTNLPGTKVIYLPQRRTGPRDISQRTIRMLETKGSSPIEP